MKSTETLCAEIRLARTNAGLKQADLARQLGVSQAAVSQFERGNTTALSFARIRQAAEIVSVELEEDRREAGREQVLKFCEQSDCLANHSYQGPRRSIVRPLMVEASAAEATFCGECGDLLLDHCPNDECGRPINEGSFCRACGSAYVATDGGQGRLTTLEVDTGRRAEIDEVLRRTRVRPA